MGRWRIWYAQRIREGNVLLGTYGNDGAAHLPQVGLLSAPPIFGVTEMNWKRIGVCILLSPILIPVGILLGAGMLLVFGLEYAVTGKYNQDDGGW